MSVRANAEMFRQVPLFAECDRAHLQVLAFSTRRREFAAGETILCEGESSRIAYLLLEGEADITRSEGDEPQPVAVAKPGTLLGELAMIAGLPYSITATAKTPLATAAIDHELFMRVVGEFPEFGAQVYTALARKLEATTSDLARLKELFDGARSFGR